MKSIWFILFIGFALVINSCGSDEVEQSEQEQILSFISANNLVMESSPTGMYYQITTQGQAPFATLSSQVTVEYKGYLLNGQVFDQTGSAPRTFPLGGLIQGWQLFIPLLGTGGEGLVLLPSSLAYGRNGSSSGGIGPNTPIAFEIKLVAVNN